MKKIGFLIVVVIALALQAQPQLATVNLDDVVIVNEETGSTTTQARLVEKVDDQAAKMTITTTVTQAVRIVELNKAELGTEKFHLLADYIPAAQLRLDELNARVAEITQILGVFK